MTRRNAETAESTHQTLETNAILPGNFRFDDLKRLLNSENLETSWSSSTDKGGAEVIRIGKPIDNADLTTVSMYGISNKNHQRLLPRIEVGSGKWEYFNRWDGYFMPKEEYAVVVDMVEEIQPIENGKI